VVLTRNCPDSHVVYLDGGPTARTTSRRRAEDLNHVLASPAARGQRARRDLPRSRSRIDGWSGRTLTVLQRGRERFVLKRTSPTMDWIVRATHDVALREGVVANGSLHLVEPLVAPYLGTASDGDGIAILMPDLSAELIAWERRPTTPASRWRHSSRVLQRTAGSTRCRGPTTEPTTPDWSWPWCPLRERLLLLTGPPPSLPRRGPRRRRALPVRVGRLDRTAPAAARALVEQLSTDPPGSSRRWPASVDGPRMAT
jgi:hypothetical protein